MDQVITGLITFRLLCDVFQDLALLGDNQINHVTSLDLASEEVEPLLKLLQTWHATNLLRLVQDILRHTIPLPDRLRLDGYRFVFGRDHPPRWSYIHLMEISSFEVYTVLDIWILHQESVHLILELTDTPLLSDLHIILIQAIIEGTLIREVTAFSIIGIEINNLRLH
jgi:hypothetical protein